MLFTFDPNFGVRFGVGDLEVGESLAIDGYGEIEEGFCPCSGGDDDGVVGGFEEGRVFDLFLNSLGTVCEEVVGGFGSESVGAGPSGAGVVDGDFVGL